MLRVYINTYKIFTKKRSDYSLLNAITGSCLLAFLDGIKPPIIVSIVARIINIIEALGTRVALILGLLVAVWIIALIIGINARVIPTPNNPLKSPIINVSALNIDDIFFLDAPIARNIPISLVLSRTEIYVIIPIIIDETTKDIETNAINT